MSLFGTTTTTDGRTLSRREERLMERSIVRENEKEISPSLYNLILGGTVAYGLLMNALIVYACGAAILNFAMNGGYWVILIGYLVLGIVGIIMARKSKSALVSFIGYNLLVLPMGALLAVYIPAFQPAIVIKAVMLTAFITLFMMGISSAFPLFFARLGMTLFVTLCVTLLVEVLSLLIFGYDGVLFDYIFVLLFSLYIGFDYCRAQAYAKTRDNAVDSAIDIYLDIINLFIRILAILGRKN